MKRFGAMLGLVLALSASAVSAQNAAFKRSGEPDWHMAEFLGVDANIIDAATNWTNNEISNSRKSLARGKSAKISLV